VENKFRASNLWIKIQMAFDMGRKAFSMRVRPLFKSPTELPKCADIFVLMPFAVQYEPVYRDHICAVAKKLSLSVARADDFFTANAIMSDVWSGICGAGVVVADCTGRNPNVFYEIGIAHTVGKRVILITQNESDVPADIRHMRYIAYQYTPPGMNRLEQLLAETIRMEMFGY
jgi:hypothetical protein